MRSNDVIAITRKLTGPIRRKMSSMIARCMITAIDDSAKFQIVNIGELSNHDSVVRFQNYGMTSVPLAGSQGVVLSVLGSKDNMVVIAVDDPRYRPKDLEAGETALYTENGVRVKITVDEKVELGLSPTQYAAIAELVDARLSTIKDAYNAHTHAANGTPTTSLIGTLASVAASEVMVK